MFCHYFNIVIGCENVKVHRRSRRVESGLDDLDNLGHLCRFFGRSSGSHPQTKLSGCNLDITFSLENSAGIW